MGDVASQRQLEDLGAIQPVKSIQYVELKHEYGTRASSAPHRRVKNTPSWSDTKGSRFAIEGQNLADY